MRLVTRTPIRGRPNDADLGQAPVIDKDLTAPPGSPSLGDRYIVASVATGAWAGQEDDIAQWAGSAWAFTTPEIGVWLYVEDEKEYYSWNGTAWVQESAGPHASTHASGGTDELTSAMLLEAQIKRIQESSGPTSLLVGQIDDADYLARVGTDILGRSPIPQTGFENRTDTDAAAMNGANLEIAPKVSTFNVYSGGKKIVINSTLQWAISTDLKEHFCTIDSSGVAQVSTTRWSLVSDDVHVATVYKDGANYDVTDERHGARHNQLWHQEHHNAVGTTYKSGLTGSFLDASFSIAQGVIYDEDIEWDTGGAETVCSLFLRTPAVTPTTMTFTPAVAVPYLDTVGDGSGILQWDDDGTPTNAGANKYVAGYVYARNSAPYTIAAVVGQAEFTTQAGAEMADLPSILLDVAEWRLLYRVVYRNVGGTATYISAQDFRRVTTGQAADATALSHAATTARDAPNSHPADAITNTPAGNIAATEVQAAIDELDAEKAARYVEVNQVAHGFTAPTSAVTIIRSTSTGWVKAQADSPANSEVCWVVTAVADVDNFTAQKIGPVDITGWDTGSGALTADTTYFLSPSTAGEITTTKTTTVNEVILSVLRTETTTEGQVLDFVGARNIAQAAPLAHATSHKDGGADELDVEELASAGTAGQVPIADGAGAVAMGDIEGLRTAGAVNLVPVSDGANGLAMGAPVPAAHAASHKNSGADEVATVTAASGAIPKADGAGKIPIGFIPASVIGGMNYQGTWDATANTPTLADGTGTKGFYYVVATAGTQDLGSGSIVYNIGDWVVHNGTIWEKIDNTDAVSSVFTRTGAVTAQANDYTHAQAASIGTDDHHAQDHAARHQNGGADEVSVAGLSGELADDQPPKDHASAHDAGGGDAMAIDAAAGTGSLRTLGTGATQAAGGTDSRLSDSRAPNGSAGGDLSGTYPNPAVDDVTLNPAPASDVTANGLKTTDTVGENVAFGDLLYMKSDGKYWKADADAVATMPGTVMAIATILADAAGVLLHKGYARDDSWAWTIGGLLYASETAGGFVQVAPSDSGDQVQVVGYAVTADIMFFDPQLVIVEVV